ncbi:APC family permease [Mycolicibacterium aubagnense]
MTWSRSFSITSLFAALLSFHNVLARYVFSLGNTRALPERCGRSHPRHDSPHIASFAQTLSALVLVGASVVAGLDPVTQVFTWFVGAASVGVVVLMTLTSAAVIVFFRRTRLDTRRWHTMVAPLLGFIGLAVLSVMTAVNLPLLVGGSGTMAAILGMLLVGAFAGGIVVAVARPHAGAQLNENPAIAKEIAR